MRDEQSHCERPAGPGRSPGRHVGGASQASPGYEGQPAGAEASAPTACDVGPGGSLRRAAAGGDDLGSLGRGADSRGSSPSVGHLGHALLPAGASGAAGTDDGLRAASQGAAESGSRAGTAPPAARTGAVPSRVPAASGPGAGHPACDRVPGRSWGPCQGKGPAQGQGGADERQAPATAAGHGPRVAGRAEPASKLVWAANGRRGRTIARGGGRSARYEVRPAPGRRASTDGDAGG